MAFLGDNDVLLHIGSPKTGTTAIQSALKMARPDLRSLGVRYPGKARSHWRASCALLQDPISMHPSDPPADPIYWQRLVRQVSSRPGRAIVSSEGFVDASPDLIGRAVAELGGDDVKVMLTARPLALVLPSMWQQSLKAGAPKPLPGPVRRVKSRVVRPYDKWLNSVLNGRQGGSRFWARFDYGSVVDRWVRVVGPDRLIVVVVDSRDPLRLMEDVEEIVGLPTGILQPTDTGGNRSLSRQEAEFVRQWLVTIERNQPLATARYRDWISQGALWNLVAGRRPGVDEHAICTPQWALEAIDARSEEIADQISSSGVEVRGDLADLIVPPGPSDDPSAELLSVPVDIAIELLNGLLKAAAETAAELDQ